VGDDVNDLSIPDLGSTPGLPSLIAHNAETVRSSSLIAHNDETVRSRAVSSVTLPPVQADSKAATEESTASKVASPDRRPFLTSALVGPKVPNFRGMTLRAVLQESAATGVAIEVLGNGLVRNQEPPAGSVLAPGARVRVQFTR